MTRFIIYGLVDPETFELKYIGRSSSGLRRPRSHWENPLVATRHDKVHRWCLSLLEKGLHPEIDILEEIDSSEQLNDLERFWIASIRASGADLKNITDGGDDLPDNRGSRNPMFGKTHPSKGKRLDLSDEQRDRRRVNLGKKFSEETRTKIRNALQGKKRKAHSPETREKMSRARKAYWERRKSCG